MKKKYDKNDEITMKEYLQVQMELEKAQKAAGVEPEEKGLRRLISRMFEASEKRKLHKVRKMTYIIIAILGGWFGAHRFYEKRYILGAIYALPLFLTLFNKELLTFVGLSVSMTIIDILIAIGHYADENGEIEI